MRRKSAGLTTPFSRKLADDMKRISRVYAAETGQSLKTIGQYAIRSTNYFSRLDQGNIGTVKVYGEMLQWFADNWPPGATWPAGTIRPKKTPPLPGA